MGLLHLGEAAAPEEAPQPVPAAHDHLSCLCSSPCPWEGEVRRVIMGDGSSGRADTAAGRSGAPSVQRWRCWMVIDKRCGGSDMLK
jgi:hypothetical protein